ncbi:hypothetical protein NQZ68_017712 [Dissostichus eleginoides]|nr:hypothetical protein NQZ68_017712 [Dissostichus eleginoides]
MKTMKRRLAGAVTADRLGTAIMRLWGPALVVWSYQSQMLRSSTTLCPPFLSSKRMVPREEDDKRLCLLLLTDLDDLTPAPHCSNRQHKMLT